jgi:hypothetical protein
MLGTVATELLDVWVGAMTCRTCILPPHNINFQKYAVTICPLYPFKFIVFKMRRSLIILAALWGHHIANLMWHNSTSCIVWDHLLTGICYFEYLHDCLNRLICKISYQFIFTTTCCFKKSVKKPRLLWTFILNRIKTLWNWCIQHFLYFFFFT